MLVKRQPKSVPLLYNKTNAKKIKNYYIIKNIIINKFKTYIKKLLENNNFLRNEKY